MAVHFAVTLTLPPPSPAPSHKNVSCVDSYTSHAGSYIDALGGSAGVIGFGADCGLHAGNKKFPALTVAQAKVDCCALGDGCLGFDWKTSNDPTVPGDGCMQKNNAGINHDAAYTGYFKDGGQAPTKHCSISDIKATAYVTYQKQAVIVVASWCAGSANVSISIDWAALGLTASHVTVSQPAVKGVQAAVAHAEVPTTLSISGATNGGAMIVIKSKEV